VVSASLRPEVIVRVGDSAQHKPGESIGYSLDSGHTWQPTAGSPSTSSRSGTIAVSADGATWVWTPMREAAYVTRDHGATWTAMQGLPTGLRVISDSVDPNLFYAVSLTDLTLYRSSDGAATFTPEHFTLPDAAPVPSAAPGSVGRGDNRGGQDRIYATPGNSGDLWLAAFDGLYHSVPAGDTITGISFAHLPGVEEIHAFGFGKAAPKQTYPALYLVGTIHGQPGIFRSIDQARTWVRINDDQHQWGLVLQIAGDPRIFGRVYVGTHGRGVFYGDPAR
jgi:hypothetical protein